MICKIANFTVEKSHLDEVKDAIAEFIAEVEGEPGTILYHSFQYQESEIDFIHTMCFTDEAAERKHAQADHSSKFTKKLYPLCVKQPEFRDLDLVGSKDVPGAIA